MQHSIGRPISSGRIPPRRAAARGIARPGANDNVGGTPSRRPQCRTAEQAIRRMSEEAPGDPGRHLVDALVSISPDRGRLPTDRRPTRRRKDSAVDVPLGCPLPAVLPAVSRSIRRFLTRSDPQSPSVFPTNAGFLGDFAESGTGSKPGARRTSSHSLTRSTVHSAAAPRTHRQGPAGPESDFTHRFVHLGVRAPLATTGSDSKPEFSVSAPSSICSSSTTPRPSRAPPVPRRLSVPEIAAYSDSAAPSFPWSSTVFHPPSPMTTVLTVRGGHGWLVVLPKAWATVRATVGEVARARTRGREVRLPAVSRSACRFLTRCDPFWIAISPITGNSGFSAETGSA